MDRINQIWPEWHTVELIGRGAFGEVYKAKREKLGEVFYSAVKVIQIPREESEVREMLADGHTSQSIRYYYESIAKGLMNEIKVDSSYPVVDKKIMEIDFPHHVIISCIIRGEQVVVPNGQTKIMAGDRLLVLATPENQENVVKLIIGSRI